MTSKAYRLIFASPRARSKLAARRGAFALSRPNIPRLQPSGDAWRLVQPVAPAEGGCADSI